MSAIQQDVVWDKDVEIERPIEEQLKLVHELPHESSQEISKPRIPSQFSGRRTVKVQRNQSDNKIEFLMPREARRK